LFERVLQKRFDQQLEAECVKEREAPAAPKRRLVRMRVHCIECSVCQKRERNRLECIGTASETLHQNLRFTEKELEIRDEKQEQA
jgi:hypothetical protein